MNAQEQPIVVVAGATRGAGRGIAVAFGEAGATVVCTGRTSRAGAPPDGYGRAETIEETAELVSAAGGQGIARAVDHSEPEQVAALASWLRAEHGHVDVLINDIWGGEHLTGGPASWDRPIWEVDLADGLRLLHGAVDTHLVTAHHLAPLLVERPGGLLVEVTDGTAAYNESHYRISAYYDLAKAAANRLAFSFGHELAPFGATAVAVTPGWLRSEMMLDNFGVGEATWRDAYQGDAPTAPPSFATSETPRFVGRGIAAIAADPDRARWNQRSVDAGELARTYGVVDVDGSQPDAWRYIIDSEADPSVDPAAYR